MLCTEYLIFPIKYQYKYPSCLGGEKKCFSNLPLAGQGKHFYDPRQLAMLTQMPFMFPLKLQKIIILLSNEPDSTSELNMFYLLKMNSVLFISNI